MSESIDEFNDIRIIESEIQQSLDEMTKNVENMETAEVQVQQKPTTVSSGCGPSPERDIEPVTDPTEQKVEIVKAIEIEQVVEQKPVNQAPVKTKVSTGCGPSPPREIITKSPSFKTSKGTSPPPQTISTQVSRIHP